MTTERKIAVVTGTNKGIGFEICRQLLQQNCHVLLTARDEHRGWQSVEQLAEPGAQIEFFQLDVTRQDHVDSLGDTLQRQYGRCDILVNNAGIFPDPRNDLDNEWPSPDFSPPFIARRRKGAAWLAFATEVRAGIVDTMSSTPTERKPARACHGAVAVEGW